MKVIWKQSLYRVTVWLAAEIILNCVGIDNLADYSEFVFECNTIDFDCSYRFSKHWFRQMGEVQPLPSMS